MADRQTVERVANRIGVATMTSAATLDKHILRELMSIVGRDYVLHDPADLMVFEYDATVGRALPQVVVLPETAEQVSEVVKLARRYGLPVTPRGAGTGLSGGAIPEMGGVVLALTRMKRILEVDHQEGVALVEPGVVNLDLSRAVQPYGLYYAPDPASQRACTIGGNVAENAGGPHCLAYGVTTNHVLGLELVLADGEMVWVGGRTRDLPGYDLTGAVIGSEGTLAIVTKVLVRLLRLPEAVRTLLAIFDEMDRASNAVSAIIGQGFVPAALEMMDNEVIQAVEPTLHVGYPMDASAVLLIEVEGLREAVAEEGEAVEQICRAEGAREVRVAEDGPERDRLWAGRKGAIGALGRLMPNYYVLDGTVPRTRLPEVLRRVAEVGQKHNFRIANVFHAGDGNLHPNILFDARQPGEMQRVLEAGSEIMRICVDAGGTITGEHGIGLEKRKYMPWLFSDDDLEAMSRLKAVFGAGEFFNPGKMFPTAKGSGEASQEQIMRSMGPDAYV
jgi:glycolate oxidase